MSDDPKNGWGGEFPKAVKKPFDPNATVTVTLTDDECRIAFAIHGFALGMGALIQKRHIDAADSFIHKLWAARKELGYD